MSIKPVFGVPFIIQLSKPAELKAANGNYRSPSAKILGFSKASAETGFKVAFQIKEKKPFALKGKNDNNIPAAKAQKRGKALTSAVKAASESIESALLNLRQRG